MPFLITDAHQELIAYLRTIWPEVSLIFRQPLDSEFEWKILREQFKEVGGFNVQAPIIFCFFGPEVVDSRWGLSNLTYRLLVHIVYCSEPYHIEGAVARLEGELLVLRKHLLRQEFHHFQVIDVPRIDLSDQHSGGSFMKKTGMGLVSGCLRVELLVGECL